MGAEWYLNFISPGSRYRIYLWMPPITGHWQLTQLEMYPSSGGLYPRFPGYLLAKSLNWNDQIRVFSEEYSPTIFTADSEIFPNPNDPKYLTRTTFWEKGDPVTDSGSYSETFTISYTKASGFVSTLGAPVGDHPIPSGGSVTNRTYSNPVSPDWTPFTGQTLTSSDYVLPDNFNNRDEAENPTTPLGEWKVRYIPAITLSNLAAETYTEMLENSDVELVWDEREIPIGDDWVVGASGATYSGLMTDAESKYSNFGTLLESDIDDLPWKVPFQNPIWPTSISELGGSIGRADPTSNLLTTVVQYSRNTAATEAYKVGVLLTAASNTIDVTVTFKISNWWDGTEREDVATITVDTSAGRITDFTSEIEALIVSKETSLGEFEELDATFLEIIEQPNAGFAGKAVWWRHNGFRVGSFPYDYYFTETSSSEDIETVTTLSGPIKFGLREPIITVTDNRAGTVVEKSAFPTAIEDYGSFRKLVTPGLGVGGAPVDFLLEASDGNKKRTENFRIRIGLKEFTL